MYRTGLRRFAAPILMRKTLAIRLLTLGSVDVKSAKRAEDWPNEWVQGLKPGKISVYMGTAIEPAKYNK